MKQSSAWLLLSLFVFSSAALGQQLELKGFRLGDPMVECPQGSRALSKKNSRQTMCSLGATTVANQPASDHVVVISGGVVIGVMITLNQQGFSANTEVLDALRDKFGPASTSKPHINQYSWREGQQVLSLNGYKGFLTLLDLEAHARDRRMQGEENKADL